jgi:uncharacterized phage infection (PIP) family protein YhgE
MDWITDLLADPGLTGGIGGFFALLFFQMGMALFRWQTASATSEGKEAEAAAKTAESTNQLAAAIGTLALTAQTSAEANREAARASSEAAKVSLQSTETIRKIGENIAQLIVTHNLLNTDMQEFRTAQIQELKQIQTSMKAIAMEQTSKEMNGKLDEVIALLKRGEAWFEESKPEVALLHKEMADYNTRLRRLEDGMLRQEAVFTIIQEQITLLVQQLNPPKPTGAASKSQARQTDDAPAPPQETLDKPVDDATASGG